MKFFSGTTLLDLIFLLYVIFKVSSSFAKQILERELVSLKTIVKFNPVSFKIIVLAENIIKNTPFLNFLRTLSFNCL